MYWCTPFCFTANLTKCNIFLDFSYASFQKGDHSPSTHEVKNCSKGRVWRQTKMAKLLLQKQSHLYMNWIFFCSAISLGLPDVLKKNKKKKNTKMWGEARYLHPIDYCLYLWSTKRVKSTDTGRPLFQKYGSTRKYTGRSVFYQSTRIYGSYSKIRVDINLRVDPCYIWVDLYFPWKKLTGQKMALSVEICCEVAQL